MNASRMAFQDQAANALVLASPGFHAGILAAFAVSTTVEIEADLLYTTKGFDSNVDEKLELAYVEVPVLLSHRWPISLSPRLFAGAIASFEVGCTSKRVLGLGELDCDSPLASVQRERTDFGLVAGGGIGFGAGPGVVFVELWANQGLRDIARESRPPGWVRHQVLLVSTGYRLARGGGP